MLALAIVITVAYCASFVFVFSLVYLALYGTIIFQYYFMWDDHMRKVCCPKGPWHEIFH